MIPDPAFDLLPALEAAIIALTFVAFPLFLLIVLIEHFLKIHREDIQSRKEY
jgi:hypothetical protein